MSEFLIALTEYTFLQNAVIACLLASIGCGVIGSYVVVKKISFLTGGIAHSVLAGMGMAYFYNASPIMGAMIAALVSSILIGWINLRWKEHEDILIAAFWSAGMAIGIIFLSRTPGYNVDLMSYLFGNILLITGNDLLLMLLLDILVLTVVLICYKLFLLSIFDEEFARLHGINTEFFYILLLCLISITIVILIQLVGLILVIALLTLPAAIANQYVTSLYKMFILSSIICGVISISGVAISYAPDLPTGSVIVLLACASYFISVFLKQFSSQKASG
ncbi:MAG TPA: metal ABC transporter permease [Thiotrichaceae bacterium]|jgi:zinc transport system permease protein|nr:metal ABC transporter permease [Thiotrichaceae bacterium]HIM08867.1 metal ABC transporter permease [Gammaproteobacteria bacterium]